MKTKGRELAPFEIRYQNGKGPESLSADAVIDATGTWFSPNPAGADGLPAIGERELQDRIAYGMPDVLGRDRARYAGTTVAVLGAGHSAIGTLIDLARLKDEAPATRGRSGCCAATTRRRRSAAAPTTSSPRAVRWARPSPAWSPAARSRSRPASRSRISAATASACASAPARPAAAAIVTVDELVVATGFRPDLDFLREIRLSLDPALECPPELAPLIDPNLHSCGTVRPHGARELAQPEPGFYFAGMKSYGRAPTFLMLTGYEQVRSIVAEIAGDHEAARKVELVLPETGVCSGPGPLRPPRRRKPPRAAAVARRRPRATAAAWPTSKAKAEGKKGCGCA